MKTGNFHALFQKHPAKMKTEEIIDPYNNSLVHPQNWLQKSPATDITETFSLFEAFCPFLWTVNIFGVLPVTTDRLFVLFCKQDFCNRRRHLLHGNVLGETDVPASVLHQQRN